MNANLTQLPLTDPAQILRYRDRQYAAELLAAAIVHLDLFSWLKDNAGVRTDAFRTHFDFAERPADAAAHLVSSQRIDRHAGGSAFAHAVS